MPTANKIESPNQKTLGVADVEFCIMCVHICIYICIYVFKYMYTPWHDQTQMQNAHISKYSKVFAFLRILDGLYILYIIYVYYICICIYSYMHTHGFLQKCDHWSSTLLAIFQHGNVLASFSVAASRKYPKPGIPSTSGYVGIHHFLPNRKSRNCSGTFSLRFSGKSADPLG